MKSIEEAYQSIISIRMLAGESKEEATKALPPLKLIKLVFVYGGIEVGRALVTGMYLEAYKLSDYNYY